MTINTADIIAKLTEIQIAVDHLRIQVKAASAEDEPRQILASDSISLAAAAREMRVSRLTMRRWGNYPRP